MNVPCDRCGKDVGVAGFDAATNLAQCHACGLVFEPMYAPEPESGTSRPLVKKRDAVAPPRGFEVEIDDVEPLPNLSGALVPYREIAAERKPVARPDARALIRWPWSAYGSGCGNLSAAFFGGGCGAWMTFVIVKHPGAPFWFVFLTGLLDLVALGAAWAALAQFVNNTTIALRDGVLRISHGPIPLRRSKVVLATDIEQIWSTRVVTTGSGSRGTFEIVTYTLDAALSGGRTLRLLSQLEEREQALYLEQALEHALGIVDLAVPGELQRI